MSRSKILGQLWLIHGVSSESFYLTPSDVVRFGTSTWTYEGWQGQVCRRQYTKRGFTRECLGEFCQYLYNGQPLFRTVGDDSSFYWPPCAQFCGTVKMLFKTISVSFQHLSGMPWTPAHGWSFAGGDSSVCVGADQEVFIETAKADHNALFKVLLGRSVDSRCGSGKSCDRLRPPNTSYDCCHRGAWWG